MKNCYSMQYNITLVRTGRERDSMPHFFHGAYCVWSSTLIFLFQVINFVVGLFHCNLRRFTSLGPSQNAIGSIYDQFARGWTSALSSCVSRVGLSGSVHRAQRETQVGLCTPSGILCSRHTG